MISPDACMQDLTPDHPNARSVNDGERGRYIAPFSRSAAMPLSS